MLVHNNEGECEINDTKITQNIENILTVMIKMRKTTFRITRMLMRINQQVIMLRISKRTTNSNS